MLRSTTTARIAASGRTPAASWAATARQPWSCAGSAASGTQRQIARAATTPGSDASGSTRVPNASTVNVSQVGVVARPTVPANTYNAMPNVRRGPLRSAAMTNDCGWNAATPRPPTAITAMVSAKLGATPISGMHTAANSSPAGTRLRRRRRSPSRPNSGCDRLLNAITAPMVAVAARLSPSRSCSSGTIGGSMPA